jgi:cell division protein FtsL
MAAPAHMLEPVQPHARPGAAARSPVRLPDLRLVTPVRDARRHVALLLAVAALGVFGVVSLNALAAESAFEAQKLERDVAGLSVRYEELTAEVAALEAPSRVRRIAVEQLGMVPAEQPGYLLVPQPRPDDGIAVQRPFPWIVPGTRR